MDVMVSMKLSIITVNLNNCDGLRKTVESVLAQSWREFEYLIIDGESTDGSAEYLASVAKDLTWWVSEKDRGIYEAMNKGIERANGEYLLFLNSGDFLANREILEKIHNEFQDTDIVYGDLILQLKDGRLETREYPDVPDNFFVYENSLPHPTSFIRKELFKRIGLYNENDRLTPDWQFFMKALFEFGATYKHLRTAVTVYNLDGLSSNPDNIEKMNQEKYRFIAENPKALTPDFFKTLDESRQILRFLGNSRIIRFVFSLGYLTYLKDYLNNRK